MDVSFDQWITDLSKALIGVGMLEKVWVIIVGDKVVKQAAAQVRDIVVTSGDTL